MSRGAGIETMISREFYRSLLHFALLCLLHGTTRSSLRGHQSTGSIQYTGRARTQCRTISPNFSRTIVPDPRTPFKVVCFLFTLTHAHRSPQKHGYLSSVLCRSIEADREQEPHKALGRISKPLRHLQCGLHTKTGKLRLSSESREPWVPGITLETAS